MSRIANPFYEPRGAAREYADDGLALNIYNGCEGRCAYCYVPGILRISREEFHRESVPRPGIVESVRRLAPRYAGRNVFLCFTCDPYPAQSETTREVLTILRDAGLTWTILTKQPSRALRDLDLYTDGCSLGATISTHIPLLARKHEPGAESPPDRTAALWKARNAGVRTWVSIEPILGTPAEVSWTVFYQTGAADEVRIGRARANLDCAPQDWYETCAGVQVELNRSGLDYVWKRSLWPYLPDGAARQRKGGVTA